MIDDQNHPGTFLPGDLHRVDKTLSTVRTTREKNTNHCRGVTSSTARTDLYGVGYSKVRSTWLGPSTECSLPPRNFNRCVNAQFIYNHKSNINTTNGMNLCSLESLQSRKQVFTFGGIINWVHTDNLGLQTRFIIHNFVFHLALHHPIRIGSLGEITII
jgi:hypothetical protein